MSDGFKPRVPTEREAAGITWCQVADGKVHAANYGYGGLTTLVEDGAGNHLCFHQSDTPDLAALRPWRDRRLLGLPVCEVCEDDEAEFSDMMEQWV